jgi:hypothetical protein
MLFEIGVVLFVFAAYRYIHVCKRTHTHVQVLSCA